MKYDANGIPIDGFDFRNFGVLGTNYNPQSGFMAQSPLSNPLEQSTNPGLNLTNYLTTPLSKGIGWNMGTAGLALSGLQTLGNLWSASQANKLAKKQFAYTKEVTDTNIANQIKSYNTSLNDRINSRAVVNGLTPEQVESYKKMNSLSRAT